jgi:hypothetical protein
LPQAREYGLLLSHNNRLLYFGGWPDLTEVFEYEENESPPWSQAGTIMGDIQSVHGNSLLNLRKKAAAYTLVDIVDV